MKHQNVRARARALKPTLLTAVLLQVFAAQAQNGPEEPGGGDGPQLETVTVSARRSIQQRFFATGSLVVLDRRDIEDLGAFSVGDVLRQLPGVQVTTNGDGSIEIRMRGMDRNATQLLIDGQRVANGGRSQLPIDQLPSEMIERIEVVRAPSAEHSGATGGTLNIVLREASVKRETVIRVTDNHVWGRNSGQAFFSRTGPLGGGTPPPAGAVKAEAQSADKPEAPWAYFVAASSSGLLLGSDIHRRTDTAGAITSDAEARGRYGRRDESLIPRLNGKLGPSDQVTLRATISRATFSGQYVSQGTGTGAYETSAAESQQYERHYLQAAGDWTHRFESSKLETTLSGSQAKDNVARNGLLSYAGVLPPSLGYSFADNRREDYHTFQAKLTGTRDPLLWSMGAQLEQRSLGVQTQSGSTAAPPSALNLDVDLKREVLWGQNEWETWTDGTLTGGLRAERLTITSSDPTLLALQKSSFLQPSLHLRKPLSEELQFRANLARVTHNPSVWNLVNRAVPSQGSNSINNPDTRGNPNLRPEVSWAFDTGLERSLMVDGKPQGQAGINLFVRQLKDAIAPLNTLVAGRWVEQRANVGDATVWGMEVDAKTGLTWAGLGRDWTLSANASLLQSRMTSGANQGERIPGQARYLANATIAKPLRRTGGFFGGATLSMNGPADHNTSPGITGRDQARTSLDVYVGSVFPNCCYWRVGIFNIGDAPYRRDRSYTDASGALVTNYSEMTLTPRVYFTLGTQF